MRSLRFLLALLVVLLAAPAAMAQYVFLDANGDGVNDASDQLHTSGPTNIDIWFVTDHNRDGSAAHCGTDPTQELTINSFEVVLRVANGNIHFGPLENRLPFTGPPVCFADQSDTTGTTLYHNGWGYRDILPPGRYLVARLSVDVLEGNPSLSFLGRSPVQPTDLTSFGTKCEGVDYDNTYVLGEEFSDAAGIGPPTADAGGPYSGVVGRPSQFDGYRSSNPEGTALQYAWSFDDGGTAEGATVYHAFETAGAHVATLTVSDGTRSDADQADVDVTKPNEPVARAGGPYQGLPGAPVFFDGSGSYDPDGDPLTYRWSFGDGAMASAAMPAHIYAAAGSYVVSLTVNDADYSAPSLTTATIAAPPVNHAPVASVGGPYEGIVGRWIQFDAAASSDPDADFLSFAWDFGDSQHGIGMVAAHTYRAAGTYAVTVTVRDGVASATARSTATIAASLPAQAFLDGRENVVNVDAPGELVIVRIQPAGGSFAPADVDPDRLLLRVEKRDGTTVEKEPVHAILLQDDSDHDGQAEFVAAFAREWFRDLVADEGIGGRTHVELVGALNRGGNYVGTFDATFVRANKFDLRVTPNPFNPVAHIISHTKSDGPVTAKLFDVRGRMMKTILHGEPTPAGRHDLVFEARDDAGRQLASGLYFLQVLTADGTRTGRVVVAK
jgi:PKD repeat protein